MKSFISIVTFLIVSLFYCSIDSVDSSVDFLVTPEGKIALGISQNLMSRKGLVNLFARGSQANSQLIYEDMSRFFSLKDNSYEKIDIFHSLIDDIQHERKKYPSKIYITAGGLADLDLLNDIVYLSREDFIALFVTGKSKNAVIDAEWLKISTNLQEDVAIDVLLAQIYAARKSHDTLGNLKSLQEANEIASSLLKLLSGKSIELEESESDIIREQKNIEVVEKEQSSYVPEKPIEKLDVESVLEPSDNQQLNIENKQSIIEQFKLSTQDTYISNLQTLILDNNIELGSDVFIEAEAIALDFLKTVIKDNTKWVGIFSYSLDLNSYSAYSGVSLEYIKEIIMATLIVFEDPLCQFESNGSLYNNKAELMRLSRFLLQYLSVPRPTILLIIDQALNLPRVTNLQQMARSIHYF